MFSLLLAASPSLIVAAKGHAMGGEHGHMGGYGETGGGGTDGWMFDDASPLCEDVWDSTAPPNVADATVLATIDVLDGYGVFSGGNGPVLGGTRPFAAYMQTAIITSFNVLGLTGTPTAAETQCAGTLEIAQNYDPNSNGMGPVLLNDLVALNANGENWTFAEYVNSADFSERRLCPCYNLMPRALFENMNCRPTAASLITLSQNYHHCQAVDLNAIYTGESLLMEMPQNRDVANVVNWQGCQAPGQNMFIDYTKGPCPCCELRTAAYQAAIAANNLVPSIFPAGALSTTWLDDTAGNCMPCSNKQEEASIAAAFNAKTKDVHKYCAHPEPPCYGDGKGSKGMGGGGGMGKGKGAGLTAASSTSAKSAVTTALAAASGLVVCAAVFAAVRRARQQQPASDNNMEYGELEGETTQLIAA